MIKDMTMGHLSTRLELKSKDEVGEMTTSMNQLADDLHPGLSWMIWRWTSIKAKC